MRRIVLLLGVCQAVFLHVVQAQGQDKNLDKYCYSQLPPSRKQHTSSFGLVHFIRICSDIDIYSDCLLASRVKEEADMGYKVQVYEKFFPPAYDLKRAGYMFCSDELPRMINNYLLDEDVIFQCEQRVNVAICEKAAEAKVENLAEVIKKNETVMIMNLSCNASVAYLSCLTREFTNCDQRIEPFFKYYFARLGPDCLLLNNVYNSIVLAEQCVEEEVSDEDGTKKNRGASKNFDGRVILWLLAALVGGHLVVTS
ncbi:unnamed protein product [Lymnaea stagnalis]|uniref:Secreted protein n=1 Tax=Lymnaea stagnalis TaxID=6523 RepID=A0AAV2HIZ6_LYMST